MADMENNINSLGLFVADSVSAMLAYWDRDLVCRFANVVYLEWFGMRREEMINKITLDKLLGCEVYEKNRRYIQGALEGKIQTFERDLILPNGQTRNVIANYFPDVIDGEVKGFVVHVADVTPIKLLEKELLESNKRITEKNKHLLNFANIVSHNLRSYANNLNSILDLLVNEESEEERKLMLNILNEVSIGFNSTVNSLTDIVKIENVEGLKLEFIYLHDVADKVVKILRNEIAASNAVVMNNIDPDLKLLTNPAYIESIVLNLLSNSIKYRHPGRVPHIEASSAIAADEIQLKIVDNGSGIDLKKHKDKLFGMYQTFHGNSDATGIGLFITKSQIDSLGGRIEVESEENTGTTFIVYFKHVPY